MPQFKTASRSAEEMKIAKTELNDMFGIVKNGNGSVNKNAIKELEANKFEIAELIIQLIQNEVDTSDPTPTLVDVVQGDIRNQYVWQEVTSDLRVVSRSYGTKPVSQRMTFTEFPMSTSHKELVVEIPLEEIASGRTTPALVAEIMADTINRYRVNSILTALDAGVPSANDRTGVSGYTLRYSGLTAANLDKAIDGLVDEGEAPTIFGRSVYLNPAIRNFAGFSASATVWGPDQQSEFAKRGIIGQYHGANVVALRDKYSRRTGNKLFSKNTAYLASGVKGAIYMTKDVSFLDFVEIVPRTSTFTVGTRIEDGLLVWDPYQYRIISG